VTAASASSNQGSLPGLLSKERFDSLPDTFQQRALELMRNGEIRIEGMPGQPGASR